MKLEEDLLSGDKSQKMTKERAEKIAQEKFPHPVDSWKREIWVNKLMEPQLTEEQLKNIHEVLHKMAALTANTGTDSTKQELKQYKKDYSILVEQIKSISPEYYDTIKTQDE